MRWESKDEEYETLTPSNQEVGQEAPAGRKDGHQEGVQVEPLHQKPVEVSHDTVLEEHQAEFAADLEPETARECASW